MNRFLLAGLVVVCASALVRADDAEDKAVAFVEKLGGKVLRDEKKLQDIGGSAFLAALAANLVTIAIVVVGSILIIIGIAASAGSSRPPTVRVGSVLIKSFSVAGRRKITPSTGMQYSPAVSFELARRLSAASQR